MGNVLDTKGNPYYKKLEIDDIIYDPYIWDIDIILSWKGKEVKVDITAA